MDKAYAPITKISDIDATVEYSGYLWLDNESTPEEIDGKISDKVDLSQMLPFIIEGNLIAKDKSHSISIRFVDGEYIIGKVDWDEFDKQDIAFEDHCYIAHGFKEEKKLYFREAWLPVDDPDFDQDENQEDDLEIKSLCENLATLQPAWIAFTGFDHALEDETND